jgi:YgiT-type zinc finger domain-containing protein
MPKSPPADDNFNRFKKLLDSKEPGECQVCGGSLELEKVNLEDYQGGKLYLMENVPAYVCGECDEIWVPEPIMQEFEQMIETAKHRDAKTQKGRKSAK